MTGVLTFVAFYASWFACGAGRSHRPARRRPGILLTVTRGLQPASRL